MALNWNISKCKNYKELSNDENWPLTNALIWASMAVGLGSITAANAKEFYARVHLLELISGNFTNSRDDETKEFEPYFITLADIERRIGLSTNVGNMSRPAFLKLKTAYYFDEIVEAKA